jgi:metallophosphoesterase superfamily enzyme
MTRWPHSTRLAGLVARYNPRMVISLGDSFHDRAGSQFLPDAYRDMLKACSRGASGPGSKAITTPTARWGSRRMGSASCIWKAWCSGMSRNRGACDGEIAGHLHPAARVVRRGKAVRRACFASDGKRLLMPAFGATTGGLELRHPAMRGCSTGRTDRPSARTRADLFGRLQPHEWLTRALQIRTEAQSGIDASERWR